jgi:5'-methylthioadenosine phosphorylase
MPTERKCGCGSALKFAIMTSKDIAPPDTRKRLGFLLDKYWGNNQKAGA